MLKENYNSPCEFAEQMIAYLYDEGGVGEKNKFEAHLKNCANCNDEFAGFNLTRSSILEWREADFDHLLAPNFDLSAITGAKPKIVVETEKSKSRFADFWLNWIFNPAFATAAILLLFVGAGIFIYSHQSSNNEEIASVPKESPSKIATAPTADKIREESSENKIVEPNKKQEIAIDKPFQSTGVSTERTNAPVEKQADQSQSIKISTRTSKSNSNNSQIAVETDKSVKPNKAAQKKKTPTLTNDDDEEDDSVRLSDLFAEIDTK